MNIANLKKIGEEVLNEEGQIAVDELLREGRIETAKEYLLGGIDSCYDRGIINFEDAAGFYNLLDLSPERASMFRQKNLGVLYS